MHRQFPRPIKRIVIKIGSSIIATYKMKPKIARLRSLVSQICSAQGNSIEIVVVSSGAIVLGMGELNQKTRSSDLAFLQATAAIGQTVLMNKYKELFQEHKKKCAQVLLTWDDFDNRVRYNNVRNTLSALLSLGITPIINENDTISTDEIKFGDNDKLSALVATLVGADLLLVLSDVEGLYNLKDGQRTYLQDIKEITQEIEMMASGTTKKQISKGGMSAKLEAVKMVVKAKIPCIIAHGETEDVLSRILKGERIGTFFMEGEEKLLARKHWISFGAKPKGILMIDEGAKKAILKGGTSLLLPGIISFNGHFKPGDIVIVHDSQSVEIARGKINYSIADLNRLGRKKGEPEAIHCDNLVLSER